MAITPRSTLDVRVEPTLARKDNKEHEILKQRFLVKHSS
jgi:hypothetical protein